MHMSSPTAERPSFASRALRELFERDRALAWTGFALLAACLPTLVLAGLDVRTFNGVSTWIKPFKFQLSVGVYLVTLAWFMGHLTPERRRGAGATAVRRTAIATGLFEVGYITLQAARAQASHFYVDVPFHAVMYGLMGVGAVLLTASSGVLGGLVWRHGRRDLAPVYRASVIAGLIGTAVLGILTGAAISANGAHWVGGATTDANGLALFGWARDGGDLRVAHFFGIHAVQILPLLGAAFATLRVPARRTVLALSLTAYAALTLGVLVQAQAGRPFLAALL